jgi:hypothetical protein
MDESWTPEDKNWLLTTPDIPPNLNRQRIASAMEHTDDPVHHYGRMIKTAVPDAKGLTDKQAILVYLRNQDGLYGAVRDYVYRTLEVQIPNLLGLYRNVYVNNKGDSMISDKDIEVCIFMYVDAVYDRFGIFYKHVGTLFEDCSALKETFVRDFVVEKMAVVLGYRAVPEVV